ncbi:hypothetical protein BJ508DRAFT_416308 [Ascobolus immersus RN42]|uniref:Uncharacterized protein n=1 Tax=Ascobolus immersus RN42 TaxID=1160509 RepID=A0A3N4HY83_ASCIM|nr:hypothetical protein BJ508DRAFT_416308 [Ascobolus immersus RN42]
MGFYDSKRTRPTQLLVPAQVRRSGPSTAPGSHHLRNGTILPDIPTFQTHDATSFQPSPYGKKR